MSSDLASASAGPEWSQPTVQARCEAQVWEEALRGHEQEEDIESTNSQFKVLSTGLLGREGIPLPKVMSAVGLPNDEIALAKES